MCANCFSHTDALALYGLGAAMVAQGQVIRVRDRLRGVSREERRQADRAATVAFLRSMDLDPDAVLGSSESPTVVPVERSRRQIGRGLRPRILTRGRRLPAWC